MVSNLAYRKPLIIIVLIFLVVGFITKYLAEAIHELAGHGLFVMLFGGQIKSFYISLLWPYERSYINWSLPTSDQNILIWVIGGGILVTIIVAFFIQFILLLKRFNVAISLTLFWLSFWCFINATGYLILGGIIQYGDVGELISMGAVTPAISLVLGIGIFIAGFFLISNAMRKILIRFSIKPIKAGLAIFWLIVPLLFVLFIMGISFR